MRASVAVAIGLSLSWMIGMRDVRDASAEATLRQWAKTILSSDVEAMTAFYERSESVTAIESTGDQRHGIDSIHKMWEVAFEEVVFESVTLDDVSVRTDGDIAWATCRFDAGTRVHDDDTRWRLRIQGSFVLRKTNGGWKIALEHFSPMRDVPRVEQRH